MEIITLKFYVFDVCLISIFFFKNRYLVLYEAKTMKTKICGILVGAQTI